MNKNQVLISGITGFVGGNFKEYFSNKFVVKGVSRQQDNEKNIISYKELNVETFNSVDSFIHLAGKAHDIKKVSDDKEYYIVNTDLTKEIFDKFLISKCRIFILMSSVKAVADSLEGELDESTFPNPQTVYGKSKYEAEKYLLSKKIPEGKYIYILRPCMIHGPGNKGNLNLLFNLIKKGIPYPLGAYENKRSFLSVDNLCFVIEMLIEKKPKSGIYNVADNVSISTKELVSIIGNTIGKNYKILSLPKSLIKVIARIGDIMSLPLNSERLEKLTEDYQVSNGKLITAIGKELPLTTYQGIEKTIKSFD